MYKTPYVPVCCPECGQHFSIVETYSYDWKEKHTHINHIQNSPSNWSGKNTVEIHSSRYNPHYAIIHKKRTDNYFVEYTNKVKGFLMDGDSKVSIYFGKLRCQNCLEASLKNTKSFEYRLNKLMTTEKPDDWKKKFSIFGANRGRVFDNFGCVTFGYTTIYGWNKEEFEKTVEKELTEVYKVKFEFVYTYSEKLNPDRYGIYCIVRPLHFLEEQPIKHKIKTKKLKVPDGPLATFNRIETSWNSNWIHPKNSFFHSVLSCFGGLHRETFESFEQAIKHRALRIIGYETPIPTPDSKQFLFSKEHFLITLVDDKRQEKYYVEGYLIEEAKEEFRIRLHAYLKGAIEIVRKNKRTSSDDFYNVYEIVSNYLSHSSVFPEVLDVLKDYSEADRNLILERCEEFKKWRIEFFRR
jgi:hypothetical protein